MTPGIAVQIDGMLGELYTGDQATAQAIANQYGRRVTLFSRWSRRPLGELAPKETFCERLTYSSLGGRVTW